MNERVVVGLSAKPGARFAMYWALYYARPQLLDIELVHIVDANWDGGTSASKNESRRAAEHRLARDTADARKMAPELKITSRLLQGSPSTVLSSVLDDPSRKARLLVIASQPYGIAEDVVYSAGVAQLAAESQCSVVIVPREPAHPGKGIVVGVDGSPTSAAAVAFAAEIADRQHQTLKVVYSRTSAQPWTGSTDAIQWELEPGDDDRLVIAEAIAGLAQKYPDLVIESQLATAQPVDALFTAARNARLVVVGSHGRRGQARYWLGSVSYDLTLTMPCMVAVVKG